LQVGNAGKTSGTASATRNGDHSAAQRNRRSSSGTKVQEQKARDCNRAFREYFEKAQMSGDREQAIAFYQKGLAICPDDDVAHYELGKAFAERGSYAEAEEEFEAALKINPNFADAKKQLDAVRKNR